MESENMIYHVMPTGAGWKVVGEEVLPSYHTTETEAVTTAREWAMVNEPSHVVIHKIDGSIEEEHLMPMDSFPHAPSCSIDIDGEQSNGAQSFRSHLSDRNTGRRRRWPTGFSHRNGASF